MIGIDKMTGQPRMTFGISSLLDGLELTVVLVSLFAIGEIFMSPAVIAINVTTSCPSRADCG